MSPLPATIVFTLAPVFRSKASAMSYKVRSAGGVGAATPRPRRPTETGEKRGKSDGEKEKKANEKIERRCEGGGPPPLLRSRKDTKTMAPCLCGEPPFQVAHNA